MTFESMINNVASTESLPLKVTYGNEMRRATLAGSSFGNLSEIVAKLFGLEQGTFVLKYQDDDDDKITVSSDAELLDATKLVKSKQLLRVFVELKPQIPLPVQPADVEQPPFFPGFGRYPFPQRGGFHHHHPHQHQHYHQQHHQQRGNCGRAFPHSSFHGPLRGGHHYHHASHGPFGFAPAPAADINNNNNVNVNAAPVVDSTTQQQPDGSTTTTTTFNTFGHGFFTPAGGFYGHHGRGGGFYGHHGRGGHPNGPWAARCAFKEHKRAMKEQLQLMKQNAVTEDDKAAIKEFKQQMLAECMQFKEDKNGDKWNEKRQAKLEKRQRRCEEKLGGGEKRNKKWEEKMEKKFGKNWSEKCQEKMQKKYGDKWAEKWQEKMEKKQRKCEKKGGKHHHNKHNKGDRLVAKHVADVTIPDNSVLPADTPVIKTWRLRNEGLVAWPSNAQLIFVSKKGDNLNGPEKVLVGAVQPAHEVEVSVPFITPSEPGRYIGYYRMADAEGAKFGQRVWVSFFIGAPATAANTTSVTAGTAQLSLNDIPMD